ncbi:MAG: hypothetical protein ACTSUE_00300 [Promethearchaeota archaeon]
MHLSVSGSLRVPSTCALHAFYRQIFIPARFPSIMNGQIVPPVPAA